MRAENQHALISLATALILAVPASLQHHQGALARKDEPPTGGLVKRMEILNLALLLKFQILLEKKKGETLSLSLPPPRVFHFSSVCWGPLI